MKSSPLIWRYVVNIKLMVKISSIFVAFVENMNLTTVFNNGFSHYYLFDRQYQSPNWSRFYFPS